jgi:hypothetical protein
LEKEKNGVILRRWNWLDDGVLPLSIIIIRGCWLVPWFGFAQRWLVAPYPHIIASWLAVVGLQALGFTVARIALRLHPLRGRLLAAVCGLLALFCGMWWAFYATAYSLWDIGWIRQWASDMVTWADWENVGVPAPFFAFLVFSILWLRGVLDGGKLSLTRAEVWRTFVLGFVALATLFVLADLDPQGNSYGERLWLFFAVGMTALAITGLKESGALGTTVTGASPSDGNRPRFDRYWAASVVTVVSGVLVMGLVLGSLIAPDLAAKALGAGWTFVRQVILYLWLIVSILLYPLAFALASLLKPLSDRLAAFQIEMRHEMADSFDSQKLVTGEPARVIVELPDALRWVALAVLICAVALVFALVLRRLAARGGVKDVDEIRESLVSRDLIQSQISEAWRGLVSRFSRGRREEPQPFLSLAGEVDARRVVREVYQSMLAVAKEHGRPRPPSQTPNEFAAALAELWAADSHTLDAITDGYVQARYASDPPSLEQAHLVLQAWRRIRSAIDSQPEDPIALE